ATGPVAQFTLVQPNITYQDGSVIDVGRYATPQFVDLDRDGLPDLVVGEQNGNLNYLRNTGTTSAPTWMLVTDSLGHVSTSTIYTLGHSVPFIFQNANGAYELLAGSEGGTLWHYTNIDGNLDGTWALDSDNFMGMNEGLRSTVCLADFTGDGLLDMVVGNFRGGVSFWSSDAHASIARATAPAEVLRVYPNPSRGLVEVTTATGAAHGKAWLSVRNSLGQELDRVRVSSTNTSLDLTHWGGGVYIIQLETDGLRHPPVRAVVQ
ncbi:MAG: T9SS type A sorting domain-containing protein, partial [Flavobacteriales bacterium]|nr:T9SS type A sorting domain-containing protein [Flavobacteriales bacterium]